MNVISSPLRKKLLFYWTALSIVVLGCAMAVAQDEDQDPPPEAGRLSAINGNVSVQPAGAQDWGQAYPNLPLGPGDRIYTDQGSRAEIQIGQTYVRVGPNTDVTLVDATNQAITIGLGAGSLKVHAFGLWPNQQLQVQTPSGTATIYRPTDFRADVYSDQQSAVFTPLNGSLDVAGAGDVGATVDPGQSFEFAGTDPVYPQWLEPAPPDDLDQWSRMRDDQVARARSYQYISRGMPGGYELDAAGDWQGGTEYGNIWFPRVEAGWAPYRNGHWINRDPWGWVWVEDEPWGYAPFHYGRWVNYRGRWGWIPGPPQEHPVWSPALVVFAGGVRGGGGGGGALSIWIPLGPGEAFRPWYRASPAYINRVNITNIQPAPRVRVQTTYVNVTNVNVTNITYVNRTMGATAVSRETFASGRPVRQEAVRVTPQQMQQVRVVERPEVQPTKANLIARPVTRPVPVKARPVMINAKGQAVAAQPHAKPEAPQVRQTVAPRPIPGRKVMAPPPNAKMTPGAQKAVKQQPAPGAAAKPGLPNAQQQPQQGNQPGQKPGAPAQTGRPTNQQQPNQPGAVPQRPAPVQPNARPGQQPPANPEHPGTTPQKPGTEQPNAHPGQPTPGQRPAPAPQRPGTQQQPGQQAPERPGQQPNARPGQPPERPGQQPNAHPGPQQRPAPAPQDRPAPAPRPDQRQANPPQRPANQPPAQSRPENRPAAPQQRPADRPQAQPQRPAPQHPDNRPGAQPDTTKPNQQQNPDKTKPKKPDQTPPQ